MILFRKSPCRSVTPPVTAKASSNCNYCKSNKTPVATAKALGSKSTMITMGGRQTELAHFLLHHHPSASIISITIIHHYHHHNSSLWSSSSWFNTIIINHHPSSPSQSPSSPCPSLSIITTHHNHSSPPIIIIHHHPSSSIITTHHNHSSPIISIQAPPKKFGNILEKFTSPGSPAFVQRACARVARVRVCKRPSWWPRSHSVVSNVMAGKCYDVP